MLIVVGSFLEPTNSILIVEKDDESTISFISVHLMVSAFTYIKIGYIVGVESHMRATSLAVRGYTKYRLGGAHLFSGAPDPKRDFGKVICPRKKKKSTNPPPPFASPAL